MALTSPTSCVTSWEWHLATAHRLQKLAVALPAIHQKKPCTTKKAHGHITRATYRRLLTTLWVPLTGSTCQHCIWDLHKVLGHTRVPRTQGTCPHSCVSTQGTWPHSHATTEGTWPHLHATYTQHLATLACHVHRAPGHNRVPRTQGTWPDSRATYTRHLATLAWPHSRATYTGHLTTLAFHVPHKMSLKLHH